MCCLPTLANHLPRFNCLCAQITIETNRRYITVKTDLHNVEVVHPTGHDIPGDHYKNRIEVNMYHHDTSIRLVHTGIRL